MTTHLDTWVARRLDADYPQLTARRSFGTMVAASTGMTFALKLLTK